MTSPLNPIITDFDDQDLYKFSMQNFLYHHNLLNEEVEFRFFNRGKTKFPKDFDQYLRYQINAMRNLSFTEDMIKFFEEKCSWFDYEYVHSYLPSFKYKPENVHVQQYPTGELDICIKGKYGDVIFWETQLMPMMAELYNILTGTLVEYSENNEIIAEDIRKKVAEINDTSAKIIEFGTRRRFSKENQKNVLQAFIQSKSNNLIGTSNVMFARKFDLKPMGTYAHELPMFLATKYGPEQANRETLGKWVECYHGALGIALPDTFTTERFLEDFDLFYAKLFDGVRWDSGDPFEFTTRIINHYNKLRIDPTSKGIVYSDGINSISLIKKILKREEGQIKKSFGIGTWLTNDVLNYPAFNWVIKLTQAKVNNKRWKYAVKLSDTPGKITSIDPKTVRLYQELLNL